MKNKIKFIIFSLIIIGSASAQQSVQIKVEPETLLRAQVQLTRNSVQKMVFNLTNGKENSSFEHADFKLKAVQFEKDFEVELLNFEKLIQELLLPVAMEVNNYISINNSTQYSKDQKLSLLETEQLVIEKKISNSRSRIFNEIGRIVKKFTGFTGIADNDYDPPIFHHSFFMKDCYSISCVTLSKDLSFQFFGLLEVLLKPILIYVDAERSFIFLQAYIFTNIKNELKNLKFPDNISTLPFDFTQSNIDEKNRKKEEEELRIKAEKKAAYLKQVEAEERSRIARIAEEELEIKKNSAIRDRKAAEQILRLTIENKVRHKNSCRKNIDELKTLMIAYKANIDLIGPAGVLYFIYDGDSERKQTVRNFRNNCVEMIYRLVP